MLPTNDIFIDQFELIGKTIMFAFFVDLIFADKNDNPEKLIM
jgi:hypothetical protein